MQLRKTFSYFIIAIALIGVVWISACSHQNEQVIPYIPHDTVPLKKHWESPIPHLEIPEGLNAISAESCGACHQEIYTEWQKSTHAVAWQDYQFQVELEKNGIISCINCHIPLQDQQQFIVKGFIDGDYKKPVLEKNPHFDALLQQESITCATCHVRDGYVIGAIGNTQAPHKTKQDTSFLNEKLCMSCHNVVDQLNPVLVCTFETGDEWRTNWASKEGKNCISCHMPLTERPVVNGFEKRSGHFHHFPGSGIPKFMDTKVEGLTSLEFRVDQLKKTYTRKDTIIHQITLQNSFAGHSVPTGDPERYFIITFRLTNALGEITKEETHRIGETWEWYPEAKKMNDNNLKPKESRNYVFKYLAKEPGNYTLSVIVTKHRMTEENAIYHDLLEKYPIWIEVFRDEQILSVE